ncbi:MAG: MFS transporter [Mangrovibacterium sp.]
MKAKSPWHWVPTLYFVEGLPYVIVMTVSVIMFQRLGISNTENALYTSLLYLPWVLKPFWSPLVDAFRTKRIWMHAMQFIISMSLLGISLAVRSPHALQYCLIALWVMAIASASQDIAIDGFYMLALDKQQQSYFVGIRSTAYRLAMLFGQGPLIIFAGYCEKHAWSVAQAWSWTFCTLAILFVALYWYHRFAIPRTPADAPRNDSDWRAVMKTMGETLRTFFAKEEIKISLLFLLVFRLGEAQLVKIASPFLLDAPAQGGLGLSTSDVGFVYGTAGVIALVVGGILGGVLVSRHGLKRWLWPMVIAMNVPNVVYVLLAFLQLNNLPLITACVVLEQFGYGFGFTAYMLYMIQIAEGEFKTAHYALCTGFMALGMMLPGMASGWLQTQLGYQGFFIWVMICTIPSFLIVGKMRITGK